MQAHQPRQGWAQGFWNHWCGCYMTSGRNETFRYSHRFTCTFSVRRHVFMWKPKGHQQSRDLDQVPASPSSCEPDPGPAPPPPRLPPRPRHYQYGGFLKAPYLTGILRELSVYGVFATCPTQELPSECSRFHFYYKPHEQLRRHSRLVQTNASKGHFERPMA